MKKNKKAAKVVAGSLKRVGRIKLNPKEVVKRVRIRENKKTVTIKDILETIKKRKVAKGKKIRWFLDSTTFGKLIRARIGQRIFCPITFYCYLTTGRFFNEFHPFSAGRRSHMADNEICKMIRAADHSDPDKILRKKLLRATNLLKQARKNGE